MRLLQRDRRAVVAAVDAVGRRRLQRRVQGLGLGVRLVVDAGVEAEFAGHVGALVGAAGDADRAAAARLRELADGAADRAAGSADDDRLPGLRLADLHQAVPGGDARHAHRAEERRQRNATRVDLAQHAGGRSVEERVLLPAAHPDHAVARSVARVLRRDDLADGAAQHHLAERLRLGIAPGVVHAPAHVRIEAQETVANQHLPVRRVAHRRLDQPEVGGARLAFGARYEMDLHVAPVGHGACSPVSRTHRCAGSACRRPAGPSGT